MFRVIETGTRVLRYLGASEAVAQYMATALRQAGHGALVVYPRGRTW